MSQMQLSPSGLWDLYLAGDGSPPLPLRIFHRRALETTRLRVMRSSARYRNTESIGICSRGCTHWYVSRLLDVSMRLTVASLAESGDSDNGSRPGEMGDVDSFLCAHTHIDSHLSRGR